MARPTFSDLRDEGLRRMGKLSSLLNSRMERVMNSAYYTLALTYHHYELHTRTTLALGAGTSELPIPADAYVVMSVAVNTPVPSGDPPSLPTEQLTHDHLYAVFPVSATGEPKRYTRTRDAAGTVDVLLLDKAPDRADTSIELIYYRRPAEPVYNGVAVSDLGPLWDEFIIQYTLQLFWPANFRFDFAGVAQATLAEFLARQIQPPLISPVRDVPERQLSSEAVGGSQ